MEDKRQNQILNAAKTLFFEHGLRATTMAAICDAAGVAKPTLYSRYKDKNAVFQAVVEGILDELRALMEDEFSKSGPIEERLAAALSAKYCAVFDMLQSPHVAKMMDDKILYAGQAFEKLNTDVSTQIESMLAQEGYTEPGALTHLILSCAAGIHKNAATREDVARDIGAVVYALLAVRN
jgi:AcrR family transcriptional regulator